MTFRGTVGRAAMSLAALCVALSASNVAIAQNAQSKSVFRDARLLDILADEEPGKTDAPQTPNRPATGVVAAPYEKPALTNESSAIRPVSATAPKAVEVARPQVAQAQYAAAKTQPAASQLFNEVDPNNPFEDKCPDPREMPAVADIPYKLIPTPGLFPESCPLPEEEFHRKAPTPITFTWKASNLCYKPLYFEDVQLERYGHYRSPLLQPFVSRFRFWLTVPCLPYLMGVNPPNECIYDLGYYRPGNCAPSMMQPIPISLRGGLLEAGTIVGVGALIP